MGLFSFTDTNISLSAAVVGAVMYNLGMNVVKGRIMEKSWDFKSDVVLFVSGYHPASRKYLDGDGIARCKDVMEWTTLKVAEHP